MCACDWQLFWSLWGRLESLLTLPILSFLCVSCADTSQHASNVRSRVSELCLELRRFAPYAQVWSCASARRSRFPWSSCRWWKPHRYDLQQEWYSYTGGAVTSVGWQIALCDPIDKWRPVILRWISRRTIRSFTFYLHIQCVHKKKQSQHFLLAEHHQTTAKCSNFSLPFKKQLRVAVIVSSTSPGLCVAHSW